MKRFALLALLLMAFAMSVNAQPAPAKTTPPAPPHTNLKVGNAAPDFTLRATDGKSYKLSDFKGKKNVVLAFYVLAFAGG
jgi:cytochrome oxidase Cu insertion factor (SCO1/SenC/PrrC family)